jgi:hypothetical protein
MTSHELARILLEMPDLLVKVPRIDMIHSIESANKAELNKVDYMTARYVTEEELKTIIISGPSKKGRIIKD